MVSGGLEAIIDELREVQSGRRRALSVPPADPALATLAAAINGALAAQARGGDDALLLEDVLAAVPHSIFWKDTEGRFLGGNRHLLDDLGLGRIEELLGRTDHDLGFPTEQADFYRRCDQEVMGSGRPLLDIEEQQDQADGTHTLLTSKVPLFNRNGRVRGLLGIYADITERKRMEEALREARDQAEAASRAKGEFLTVVSHELRTPLTLILGPLDGLLARADLPEEARQELERARRNAGRLLLLVNDLLSFTMLEAGRSLDWERLDVAQLAGQLVADARPAAARAGLELRLVAEPDLGLVTVDRERLEKIALNLVGNALKFTPAGGHVEVTLRSEGDVWELAVRDDGPGIPAEKQALLFRRFQQLEPSARRRHEGSGIGLALVKELAESMGGRVGFESAPGAGSRFFVRLPRVVADAAGQDAALQQEVAARSMAISALRVDPFAHLHAVAAEQLLGDDTPVPGLPRVLVADDNADMRAWLRAMLRPACEVSTAADGAEALALARQQPPSLVIADVMMPVMDGLELVRRLKADSALAGVPVLLLTAKAGADEAAAALDLGADDYITKPFGPAELISRVRAALRLREAGAALEREHRALAEAHEALRRTQSELVHQARVAAVGTLVAGLCHELNNPLSVILMHTQQLLSRVPAEEVATHKSLAVIERHTRRCAQLVSGLLDFSRKKQPRREPLAVAPLLERVALLMSSRVKRGDLQLALRPEAEGGTTVEACLADIETALVNLIGNALDVAPPGSEVVLAARPTERQGQRGLELSVADRGPGIPDEVLPQVFDPFFTTKPAGQGTGLGLSIARKIVEDHRGHIDIDTGPGGTTVRLFLPAAAPASPSASPNASPPAPPPAQSSEGARP